MTETGDRSLSHQATRTLSCRGFSLRPAAARDQEAVRTLMEWGGMDLAADWQDAVVAVDEADEVVGYLRIQHTDKGPHVAPIAVREGWQGRGVGRVLMADALERHGTLKLVSRGDVAGFYRSLGCTPIPFEEISGDLEEDCEHCPDRSECRPVAFALAKEQPDA